MKYKGNLKGVEFNRKLNKILKQKAENNIEVWDVCCHCIVFNGECYEIARQGMCAAYDRYHKEIDGEDLE